MIERELRYVWREVGISKIDEDVELTNRLPMLQQRKRRVSVTIGNVITDH